MKCNVLWSGLEDGPLVQPEPFVDQSGHIIHGPGWKCTQQPCLNTNTAQRVAAMTLRTVSLRTNLRSECHGFFLTQVKKVYRCSSEMEKAEFEIFIAVTALPLVWKNCQFPIAVWRRSLTQGPQWNFWVPCSKWQVPISQFIIEIWDVEHLSHNLFFSILSDTSSSRSSHEYFSVTEFHPQARTFMFRVQNFQSKVRPEVKVLGCSFRRCFRFWFSVTQREPSKPEHPCGRLSSSKHYVWLTAGSEPFDSKGRFDVLSSEGDELSADYGGRVPVRSRRLFLRRSQHSSRSQSLCGALGFDMTREDSGHDTVATQQNL